MIISPARDSNGGSQYLVLLTVSVQIKQVMGQKKKKKLKNTQIFVAVLHKSSENSADYSKLKVNWF